MPSDHGGENTYLMVFSTDQCLLTPQFPLPASAVIFFYCENMKPHIVYDAEDHGRSFLANS